MKLHLRSFALLAAPLALVALSPAQLSGLKTNLRTYGGTGLNTGDDTHDYRGPGTGPSLSGHSQAASADVNASFSASADATAAFGDLWVDLHAHTQKNPDGAASATITHDGAASTEYFDRIYVNGSTPGQAVMVHLTGLLTDLYRVDGNNRNIYNYPQGVDAYVFLSGYGSTPSIHLTSYRAGADVFEDHSGSFDYATTVGSYFDVNARLYGDAGASDTYFRSPIDSADGITQGRFLTNLRVDTAGVSLLSASGHNYQAVPEPASFVALGVGALGLLRRRSRRP